MWNIIPVEAISNINVLKILNMRSQTKRISEVSSSKLYSKITKNEAVLGKPN